MKSVVALAAVAIIFVHFKTTSSKIIIPRELEELENDEDTIAHVNYILTRHQTNSEKRAPFSVSDDSADQCEAPDNANIVTVVTNKSLPVSWWNRPVCDLVIVPVKIDVRKLSNPFPSYVRLARCMGSSKWLPTIKHCTVKKKEQITVKYMDFLVNQEFASTMYNHTACEEECIVKNHHCNPVTENYDDCQCKCKINDSFCDSSYQTFDRSACECRCTFVQQCSLYRQWNPVSCKCQCAKSIRDMCKKAGHLIDESSCSCVLPPKQPQPPPPPTTTSPPQPPPTMTSPPQPSTTGSSSNNINVI